MADQQAQEHPFDALHKQFLIDLNGDGVPDVATNNPAVARAAQNVARPPPMAVNERRDVQRRSMAGRDLTPRQEMQLSDAMPGKEQRGQDLASIAPMLLPVGGAAMTAASYAPRTAAAGLAALGLTAGSSEAGSPAQAGVGKALNSDPDVSRARKAVEEAQRRLDQANDPRINYPSKQARQDAVASYSQQLQQATQGLWETEQRARGAYAENAPFRERYPGVAESLLYGAMGLSTAMPLAGTIKNRLADFAFKREAPSRLAEGGSFIKQAGLNSLMNFEAAGLPEQVDALSFSPGHPVRETALNALTDPSYYESRVPAAVLSGLATAGVGTEVGRLLTPGPRRPTPGTTGGGTNGKGGGPQQGVQPPVPPPVPPQTVQNYRTYPELPQPLRQNVQDAYVFDRTMSGAAMPPRQGAQGIKDAFSDRGINVPVTPQRVNATNQAVQAFVQANGRMPANRAEWQSIFNRSTLAVPGAYAANALAPQDDTGGMPY